MRASQSGSLGVEDDQDSQASGLTGDRAQGVVGLSGWSCKARWVRGLIPAALQPGPAGVRGRDDSCAEWEARAARGTRRQAEWSLKGLDDCPHLFYTQLCQFGQNGHHFS